MNIRSHRRAHVRVGSPAVRESPPAYGHKPCGGAAPVAADIRQKPQEMGPVLGRHLHECLELGFATVSLVCNTQRPNLPTRRPLCYRPLDRE